MTRINEVHAPELADGLVRTPPAVWEPATFILSCPRGHEWDSSGNFHAPTRTNAPIQRTCPRRGCGQLAEVIFVYWGPNRPTPVEAWKR